MLRDNIINYRLRFVIGIIVAMGLVAAFGAGADTPWIEHRLAQGETIYGIARRYGVPAQSVLSFNDISDPTRLAPGRVIRIPGVLTVTRGQTLYGIARQYGLSVTELRSVNDLSPEYVLRIGDRLRVPADFGSAPPVTVAREDTGERGEQEDSGSVAEETTSPDDRPSQDSSTEPTTADSTVPREDESDSRQQNGANAPVWPHTGARSERGGRVPGVSIDAEIGDSVYAVASGTVTYVGPYATFGRVVIVQAANGYAFVYGGHGNVVVSPGDRVVPGTLLGSVGNTGQVSTVYFSVWRGDNPVNPADAPRL
ncbi:MAG: LysM peptidoglycan-binding domain-containing protein [Spirochaetaceae bacterium]|nr:MAG: LysM peptidoglycan-binding domain-containing protein [Spirochaetaceae bacterium]